MNSAGQLWANYPLPSLSEVRTTSTDPVHLCNLSNPKGRLVVSALELFR